MLLVTDGATGFGEGSLKQTVEAYKSSRYAASGHKFSLPFKFPCKLHVLLLADPADKQTSLSASLLRELIKINNQGGELFLPDGVLSLKTVQAMFSLLSESYFAPFAGVLKCGNLKCPVQVYPTLENYDRYVGPVCNQK